MSGLPSYPKIWNIGHYAIDGIFNDNVIVQEKVDGSQISFGKIDEKLHVRSKNATILDGVDTRDNGPDGGTDMFTLGVQEIVKRFDLLPDGVVFRGEYLNKPKHNTLKYDRVPTDHIVLFDAQDIRSTGFLVHLNLAEFGLGFDVVPQLSVGTFSSHEQLMSLLDNESFLGGPKIEGFVIKNYERLTRFGDPMFGKYVSEAFKENHSTDWKNRNPNGKDTVANLVEVYRTEARWTKAVQHLRDEGRLRGEPADIGPLMGALAGDVIEECKEEIMEELWKQYGKRVVRGVQGGFAEWYKDQLAQNAFAVAA